MNTNNNWINNQPIPPNYFFDKSSGLTVYSMSECAKLLNLPGIGRNILLEYLKKLEIFEPNNLPAIKYLQLGYFKIGSGCTNYNCSSVFSCIKTTAIGLDYIQSLVPLIYEIDENYIINFIVEETRLGRYKGQFN